MIPATFDPEAWIHRALKAGVRPSAVPFPTKEQPNQRGLLLDESEATDAGSVLAELCQPGTVRAIIDALTGEGHARSAGRRS